MRNELTSYTDIGVIYEGQKLTAEEYLKVEDAYINAITAFASSLNVKSFFEKDLERYNEPSQKDELYSHDLIDIYKSIKKGSQVDANKALNGDLEIHFVSDGAATLE